MKMNKISKSHENEQNLKSHENEQNLKKLWTWTKSGKTGKVINMKNISKSHENE